MTEIPKTKIRTLLNEVTTTAIANNWPIANLRGTALFDGERDQSFVSLQAFGKAAEALLRLPNFIERFGPVEVQRVLLQFIYQYFERAGNVTFLEDIFEILWDDLTTELNEVGWLYRGVANLRHFRTDGSPLQPLDLGDGITIRGRIRTELKSLGFDDPIWERIAEDWETPFGHSSHVLVVEHRVPKERGNLILMHSGSLVTKALRALQALRLCGTGSISIGRMWPIRAARFNVGISGIGQSGFSVPTMGSEYLWTEDVSLAYSAAYRELAQLEKDGYQRAPGNLEVALRVFQSTYDRWPSRQDSQLLDAITTLEALLGIDKELSFRLAFRVAGLLADSDKERGELFKLMRGFYDTRSKIVHGGALKQKEHAHLANVDELLAVVRRLLRSFVAFAVNPPSAYSKTFFQERLDIALVDAAQREKLRIALGLV
jgi:Apea-like HEPN